MRSTFSGLNTMVRGIFANQLAQDTTGHNITNAGTEGYSRQKVNQAATRAQSQYSIYGNVLVGTGVDSLSLTRARNIYADKQFWNENSTQNYYSTMQTNYDKIEAVFDDSDDTGIQNSMKEFYQAWSDLSTSASTASNRVTVIEKGNMFADSIQTAAVQLQEQINAEYEDLKLNITKFNDITEKLTVLNRNILTTESAGAMANDLRDERDLLVDQLSEYVNLNVYEGSNGMYTIVSNGITLVNGKDRLTLRASEPMPNTKYGINDYNIEIVESGIVYQPLNGSFKGHLDAVAENKRYLDDLSSMAAFLLTNFNDQHRTGSGIDVNHTSGLNFFGDNTHTINGNTYNTVVYSWDESDPQNKRLIVTPVTTTQEEIADSALTGDDVEAYEGKKNYKVTYTPTTAEDDIEELSGIQIIKLLEVASELKVPNGEQLVAARSADRIDFGRTESGGTVTEWTASFMDLNGTGDGSNAVLLSSLLNMTQAEIEGSEYAPSGAGKYKNAVQSWMFSSATTGKTSNTGDRAIGAISLNSFYTDAMSRLGNNSQSIDTNIAAQDDVIAQIVNWRASTSAVDWNEELSNMLTFQKGYSACSRCLTTMDEMLDRLINNTGVVGR